MSELRKRELSPEYYEGLRLRFPMMMKFCNWKTLTDITPDSFLKWRNSGHGYAICSQNHFLDTMRVFLNWVAGRYNLENPLKLIQKTPKRRKSSNGPRAFTEDELARLYAAAPRRQFFYRFMTFTGLRHKEARRLQWGDVKLDILPTLFLRPEATKGRRADELPIVSLLVPDLQKARPVWAKETTPVFHRGVPNHTTFHRDCAKAGIPYKDGLDRTIGFHTFRRTFITLLQKLEVPSRVIAKLARHKSLNFTDYLYTDATQLPDRQKIEVLGNLNLTPASQRFFAPQIAPQKSAQNGFKLGKSVLAQNAFEACTVLQTVESEATCVAPANPVQNWQNLKVVGEQGLEPWTSCV